MIIIIIVIIINNNSLEVAHPQSGSSSWTEFPKNNCQPSKVLKFNHQFNRQIGKN